MGIEWTFRLNQSQIDQKFRATATFATRERADDIIRTANALLVQRRRTGFESRSRPGHVPFRQSWTVSGMSGGPRRYERTIGNSAPHAKYVEEGYDNRGATIFPRNGTALKFRGSDGSTVYAPEVQGGSFEGHHVLRDAVNEVKGRG